MRQALQDAKAEKLIFESDVLTGYSSKSLTALLQNLCLHMEEGECYLEVGVFQGLSLLSMAGAVKGRNVGVFGIDNFSQFDEDGKNFGLVRSRAKELALDNYEVINRDFEEALLNLGDFIGERKLGVYFVDGPHDYRSQLLCLEMAKGYMADQGVIVIDDCNYVHVRQATYDFIRMNPEYKLVYQAYSEHHPHQVGSPNNKWWNGINVLCKSEDYATVLPEVRKDMMFAEHGMMTQRYPLSSYEAGLVASALRPFRPIKLIRRFLKLWKKVNQEKNEGSVDYLNTFSEKIEKEVNNL